MTLAQYLDIRPGVTAFIGGGGKTTLLHTLGRELAADHRVLLCTTTKIFPFPDLPLATEAEELEKLAGEPLVCGGTPLPNGKLTALPIPMSALAEQFDYVLVEADGSAGRPFKAHDSHEPVIPSEAIQAICVLGASGFGKPIEEAAHRPELYAALSGVSQEEPVTPEIAAAVLQKEQLHQKIYVNQAENETALAAAHRLQELLTCPVLAGSLWKGEYVPCWL